MKSKKVIVLSGIQHAGKTTLGRLLAQALKGNFFDTDLETERLTGKHPRIITAEGGQKAYNIAETQTINHILSNSKDTEEKYLVISTGGGFCDNPEGVEILKKSGWIICLNPDLETGAKRILDETKIHENGSLEGYPIYPGYEDVVPKSMAEVKKIYYDFQTVRKKRYLGIADIVVDVTDTPAKENADILLQSVRTKL